MRHSLPASAMIAVSFVLVTFVSCQETEKGDATWYLTGTDSTNVIKEVSAAVDALADSYAKMDPDKSAQFWERSPEMMYAENGEKYANWDSIFSAIKGIYSKPVESVEVRFESRDILPLSRASAHVFLRFDFRVKFKPDRLFHTKGFLTALLVKKGATWKIMSGHESWKPVADK